MNKRFTITLLLLLTWVSSWSQQLADSCKITYIANEGFLLETAKHKILIDALFGNIEGNWCDQPGDSLMNLMFNGIRPFNDIEIILISHSHSDHFWAPLVINFLQKNSNAVLVCPEQVNEVLMKNKEYASVSGNIHPLKSETIFDTTLYIHEASIRVLRLKHGSWFEKDSVSGKSIDLHQNVENFGYLIKADGFTFLHTGDGSVENKAQFSRYDLAAGEIDVAFFDRVFLRPEGLNLIGEYIRAKNIIFMHIEPGKGEYYRSVIKSIPEMFVFLRPGEKRTIVRESGSR
jgi:L-ascorbate metabolism protein UlaG (beta-lactamase superfamily)